MASPRGRPPLLGALRFAPARLGEAKSGESPRAPPRTVSRRRRCGLGTNGDAETALGDADTGSATQIRLGDADTVLVGADAAHDKPRAEDQALNIGKSIGVQGGSEAAEELKHTAEEWDHGKAPAHPPGAQVAIDDEPSWVAGNV